MPQLTLTDKINPIAPSQQRDKSTQQKRIHVGISNQHIPFLRAPTRVPFKRISDNKIVSAFSVSDISCRSRSAPRPRISLKQNILNDYGEDINNHLKNLEANIEQKAFLGRHQIQADYRSKMVDWMLEVLTTFKNSDQTFFLAVGLMDRFYKQTEKTQASSDLHLTGVVSMFVASKYEDIVPLMMRTVINKIGHNKFELRQIEDKELDLLRVLEYKIGAPTIKEFLDRFLEELGEHLPKSENIYRQLMCLSKMACYSYDLMQAPSSLIAASILLTALKQNLISSQKMDAEEIISLIANFSGHLVSDINEKSQFLLKFAKNFDNKLPNLRNLKLVYGEELKTFKFFSQNVKQQNGPSQ